VTFEGKVAIVTGASSGIGYETALALGRRGTSVVAVARRSERLADLASQMEGRCFPLAGDLEEPSFA